MRHIYREAVRTVAWLGKSTNDSDQALDALIVHVANDLEPNLQGQFSGIDVFLSIEILLARD